MENKENANEIIAYINDAISKLELEELIYLRDLIKPVIEYYNTKYYSLNKHWDCSLGEELSFSLNDLCEIKDEVYTDSKSIKNIAKFIYDQYNNIICDTTSIVDIANKLTEEEISFEERYNISSLNRFICTLKLEHVILKEDLKKIQELIKEDSKKIQESGKKDSNSYEGLRNYLKKSKSNGLVLINDYHMRIGDYSKDLDKPFGIFDYKLLCNALKKLGLNVYLEEFSNCGFYKGITYDRFLKCLLSGGSYMIISDKRFEIDKYGHSIYTPLKKENQKTITK